MSRLPEGLPRSVDIQRFAGAREQEVNTIRPIILPVIIAEELCFLCQIQALQTALSEQAGAKTGVDALPRHLRRHTVLAKLNSLLYSFSNCLANILQA